MTLDLVSSPPELVKYRVIDEIGHGGMATVYRAMDVRLKREVAVKLMHPHMRDNPEAAARFVTEARAVAQLRHPGIVEIFDVSDEQDKERFLVAELIRGPALRVLLKQHTEIPPEIGACFAVLLCDALWHAHDKGIIHRDVKPENVLVELNDKRGIALVKLTDFGIAKVIDAQSVTSTGQVLGSPAHMAPEQIDAGTIDARTDVFGLGVLMYECMVGHLPFDGKNPAQVLRKVLSGDYAKPDNERPTVGRRWAAIIEKAIDRDPDRRWQDVKSFSSAMMKELQAVGMGEPREEIYAYLSDPDGYTQRFTQKLVAALTHRANKARESGDMQGAADDLNRAVAYAPNDNVLLHQLTSLARGMRRNERIIKAKRVILIGVSAAVLLSAAGLIVYVWYSSQSHLKVSKVEPLVARQAPAAPVISLPPPEVEPIASSVASAAASTPTPIVTRTPARPATSVTKQNRDVLIRATPGSALVSVDGQPPVKVGFGLQTSLSVGSHSLTFSTPAGDPCCHPKTLQVQVVAGEGAQVISGGVNYRDAQLSLVGGPADAALDCPAIGKTVRTDASVSVSMSTVDLFVTCFISGTGITPGSRSVTLRAGQSVAVAATGH